VSPLDSSVKDLARDPRFSRAPAKGKKKRRRPTGDRRRLTLSNAQLGDATKASCVPEHRGDPENPPCSRLTLSGNFTKVAAPEWEVAKAALEKTHPNFKDWGCFDESGTGPGDHAFFLAKMAVDRAWLIDFYGGAAVVSGADYLAA